MIVIPMAGQGRRFREAGYTRPKYELPMHGDTLFACCVRSFERYFNSERFLFVARGDHAAADFIATQCARLGIADHRTVLLERPGAGPAEAVLLGLRGGACSANESLLIFNLDTIRPGYVFPPEAAEADGYLDVVRAAGEHWSFVRPAASFTRRVAEITDERRISDLCCTSLFHFARAADFMAACDAALHARAADLDRRGKLYIAPLYNTLIDAGRRIVYVEAPASRVHVTGTPAEYGALMASHRSLG